MSGLWVPPSYQPATTNERPERPQVTRAGGVVINSPERQTGDFGSGDEIEIMPSERAALMTLMTQIQSKYVKPGRIVSENDLSLMEDDIQAAATRVGLIVNIVWKPIQSVDGEAMSPVVEFIGRLESEFDNDQMSWEIQHGLDDGVVGKTTMDGKLVEPTKVL